MIDTMAGKIDVAMRMKELLGKDFGKIKVYTARSMSFRVKEEVVAEALKDRQFLVSSGFVVLCPVEKEEVPSTKQILLSSKKAMLGYWPADKKMIEESHVLFDMSPQMKSEGVAHEIGYARYFLYRPIVRVYPAGKLPTPSSVAWFEDDFICDSLEEAVEYVYRVHGTLWKRLKWRIALYSRCLPKMVSCWIRSWK